MKKLLLILVLFISTNYVFSQAPKKSNTILVSTIDSESEALKKIGRILLNEGFVLETIDKDFYTLVTKPKTCNYGMLNAAKLDVKISVQIDKTENKSVLSITGKVNSPDFNSYNDSSFDAGALIIENKGPKSSISGASWLIMDNIAKNYEEATIEYLTK